jgi:hypothetical protein
MWWTSEYIWKDSEWSKITMKSGNCFRTKAQARRALSLLKKTLLQFHENL